MKSRKFGIGLLLMLAFVVTTGTFAYWASSVAGDADTVSGTVKVGTGDAVTTTVTVTAQSNTDGNLVPDGFEGGTDINNLDLTFPVIWDANEAGASGVDGTLVVSLGNYAIGTLSGTDVTDLFTITVTSGDGAITEGSSQDVIINVFFANEPADAAEYAIVAGANLTFDVTFTVTTP